MDYVCGSETGTGVGGFIVGTGNYFTAVMDVTVTSAGATARATMIISGLLTSTGITNLYYANFMIDNKGNTTTFIKNSTGRVIYDSDGFSPIITSIKAANVKNDNFNHSISTVWTENK